MCSFHNFNNIICNISVISQFYYYYIIKIKILQKYELLNIVKLALQFEEMDI